jgi:uncharacterized cupin superfamily protein
VVGWEPGQKSPIHCHPTADEIYHVPEGKGVFNDGGEAEARRHRDVFPMSRPRAHLERAGVSRSVAMKLIGHKTEAVYRHYAIVAETNLREAGTKLAAALGPSTPCRSLGDDSVTARKVRSLNG